MTYVVREMPGVAAIEARIDRMNAHPNPLWAPEYDGLYGAIDVLIERLFGLSPDDLLDFELDPEDQTEEFWKALEAHGWDVNRADGTRLRLLDHLLKPIVVVVQGLGGHLPDKRSDRELGEEEAASIEARLRAEAAKFRPKR